MFQSSLLNPRVLIEIAIAAAVVGLCWWAYNAVYDRGADSVQRKWDAAEKERSDESARVATKALDTTKSLQESADKQRSASNAQMSTLNTTLAAAVAGLRDRPARPDAGGVPTGAGVATGVGCTGAQLYRPDAELLTRESARAQRLLFDLQACQARYQSVYEALNGAPPKQ